MKISVLIPTWSGTKELMEMAFKLAQSVRPQCDELVITEDSNFFSQELFNIADTYILHQNWGDMKNTVGGFRLTTGDYVATIQSDVRIQKGHIRDLCIPG